MLEDRLLVWKLNRGSIEALSRIYEKYKDDLLRLATALSNNVTDAEDIVQDVFVGFAQSAGHFQLTGSLKSYLATCVANRARNKLSVIKRKNVTGLHNAELIASNSKSPNGLYPSDFFGYVLFTILFYEKNPILPLVKGFYSPFAK